MTSWTLSFSSWPTDHYWRSYESQTLSSLRNMDQSVKSESLLLVWRHSLGLMALVLWLSLQSPFYLALPLVHRLVVQLVFHRPLLSIVAFLLLARDRNRAVHAPHATLIDNYHCDYRPSWTNGRSIHDMRPTNILSITFFEFLFFKIIFEFFWNFFFDFLVFSRFFQKF